MSALVDGETGAAGRGTTPGAAKDAEITEADAGNWHAVGFAGDLHPGDVYGTKFLGEPQVIYRDAEGEATCLRDVCPHRSAPLSMGDVKDGGLRCFYHGWSFGAQGECVDVPTVQSEGAEKQKALKNFCAKQYPMEERDGLLWLWHGRVPFPLHAAPEALREAGVDPSQHAVVDTTLDYDCDWTVLVDRYGQAPFLDGFWGLGGRGDAADAADAWRRADRAAPTALAHAHASGAQEEAFVVPLAPGRSRVLLRQRLPKRASAALALLALLPGGLALFSSLLQGWNYKVAADGYGALKGANPAPSHAMPYFSGWDRKAGSGWKMWDRAGIDRAAGRQAGQQVDSASGTYGIKRSYVMDLPVHEFPPSVAHSSQETAQGLQWLTIGALSVPAVAYVSNVIAV